ncbi:helix-turn-helix domain-containing protein [Psychrobacillus faecigallinarum]|nr:helix-turn-helix transcriptional regulator [Psychrobacillus faecigallinarum]
MLKEMRGEQTQLSLGLDINTTRETVSKYENGRSKVPSDISRTLVKKFDNAKFAITVRNEYTGTGPKWLDGPNVDLHRSSVKEKTVEEMKEALDLIVNTCLAKPLKKLQHFELQSVDSMLQEAVEAITALDHFIAVVCKEAEISYTEVWDKHYKALMSAGYLGGTK